jgi:3',5'-cyclic AMP phosphodiesterase CpdA
VPAAIDAGRVAVELEVAVASREVEGGFDDQPRLRIAWLGAEGEALGSLETLAGSGRSWHIRGATGLVPPGTREARIELDARLRRLPDNDAMMDDVQVRLHEVEPRSPAVTRLPMLQDHRTDAMRLLWETDGNLADHSVAFGPAEDGVGARQEAVRTIAVDDDHYVHVADLEGLSTGSAYAYQVQSGDTLGAVQTLRTAPEADTPTRIAWMADNQEGAERFATHIGHLSARDPDLLVVAGDLVSDMHSLDEWRDYWWAPLEEEEFGSRTPVLVARGNHDRHHPYAYAYTAMPEGEDFYSFRYGSVFVVTLDTQQPMSNQPPGLDQRIYLEAALASEAARSADFRVAVFHQAPYSNVRQDASDGNATVREVWMDLIVAGGVDLVVAGHYHSYQRGELDGVTHVVVGGGGSHLLVGPAEDLWSHMTLWEQAWHYSVMDVEDGQLSWVTYDLDDEVLDSFTLEGGPLE